MSEYVLVVDRPYTVDAFRALVGRRYLDPKMVPHLETAGGAHARDADVPPGHPDAEGTTCFVVRCSNHEVLGVIRNMPEVVEIHDEPDAPGAVDAAHAAELRSAGVRLSRMLKGPGGVHTSAPGRDHDMGRPTDRARASGRSWADAAVLDRMAGDIALLLPGTLGARDRLARTIVGRFMRRGPWSVARVEKGGRVTPSERDLIRAQAFEEAAAVVESGCGQDARMHLVDALLEGKAAQVRRLATSSRPGR